MYISIEQNTPLPYFDLAGALPPPLFFLILETFKKLNAPSQRADFLKLVT